VLIVGIAYVSTAPPQVLLQQQLRKALDETYTRIKQNQDEVVEEDEDI
jgi:hypothetical protein